MADYTSLKNKAQQVRDEVQISANTAYRVGDAIMGTVEAAEANANAIAAETERATTKETNLQNQISEDGNNIQRIQDEIEDLPSIRSNIDANTDAIAAEVSRAEGAETELQDAISTEATRAQTKENELLRHINDASERITENAEKNAEQDEKLTELDSEVGTLNNKLNRNILAISIEDGAIIAEYGVEGNIQNVIMSDDTGIISAEIEIV